MKYERDEAQEPEAPATEVTETEEDVTDQQQEAADERRRAEREAERKGTTTEGGTAYVSREDAPDA